MPAFLWSGKDEKGRPVSERVEAWNAQAAKSILASRGWTELELIGDEVFNSEAIRVEPPDAVREQFEKLHTPARQAAFVKTGRGFGATSQTWDTARKSIPTILISAALLAWGLYRHRTLPIVIGSLGLAVGVLLTPALHLVFSLFARTSRDYSRLNRAKVWARWDEVLECVEKLRRPDGLTGAKVPEIELARSRAQALAALGRVEEGLVEFKKFERDPKVEHWLYLTFLGGIYDTARQFEKGLEVRRQAAAEKPDAATVWIDVAYAAVRRLNRPAEAREALARAERLEISGLGKSYVFFLRGIISWREHNPAEASVELERALAGFQSMAHFDLVEGLLLLTKSYLCAAHCALGNLTEARELFAETEPFLLAHREDDLLEACRPVRVPKGG
jgi:tetratricopeptide (TPR) repeat protein